MTNTLFPRYQYEPSKVDDDGRIRWAPVEADEQRRAALRRLLDRKRLELTAEEVAEARKQVDELSALMIEQRREFKIEAEYMRS